MKRVVIFAAIFVMLFGTFTIAANFSDVSADFWANGFINSLADKNVINGYPDGTFKPDNILTYGEFIKLIVMASLPDVDFSMLDNRVDHWAAPYLTVLENYEIIGTGWISAEDLDGTISRIEVVRILGECDIKMRGTKQKTTSIDFNDIDDLTYNELALLRHAVASEIINGDPEGTFRPSDTLIRSEAAKIISVYMDK